MAANSLQARNEFSTVLGPKSVTAHYRAGKAAQEVVQLAVDVDADLILVGTRGKTGVKRMVLGSVSETILRKARCPVMVVRPKDHENLGELPSIQPPCPDCLEIRAATNGKVMWCEYHANMRRVRPHKYTYTDPSPASTSSVRWGSS